MSHPRPGPVQFGRPAFLPPVELRALPFNALRHQLPTQNPVQAGRALQAALRNAERPGYTAPTLMPRRLVQSRWKRAPGGRVRGGFLPAGSSVGGLFSAILAERARRAQVLAVTSQRSMMLSADAAALARGQQRLAHVPGQLPTPGPARTLPRVSSVPAPGMTIRSKSDLETFIRDVERAGIRAHAARSQAQSAQFQSAHAAIARGGR